VIAFVGSEATGKSTLIDGIGSWLAPCHRVRRIHAGKPPATALTFVPHVLLPALRALFPDQRSTRVESRSEGSARARVPLLFALRSVMLAHERRALLTAASRWSAEGTIVLCDRYPSRTSGAPDSPQLGHLPAASWLRRRLAAMEARLYDDVPPPDLVLQLTAPLEVTLARNAARAKTEPEDYVRRRHCRSADLEFDGAAVHHTSTDRPLEDVVLDVKEAVAGALEGRTPRAVGVRVAG
jgi:thymidylate kinase